MKSVVIIVIAVVSLMVFGGMFIKNSRILIKQCSNYSHSRFMANVAQDVEVEFHHEWKKAVSYNALKQSSGYQLTQSDFNRVNAYVDMMSDARNRYVTSMEDKKRYGRRIVFRIVCATISGVLIYISICAIIAQLPALFL